MSNNLRVRPTEDKEFFREVSDAIKANGGYCCCAIARNEDTLCMCRDFREQTVPGPCACGRYVKFCDE